jgi:hypothetical protein
MAGLPLLFLISYGWAKLSIIPKRKNRVPIRPRSRMSKNIFYVYYLRRPDKEDPLWPGADQPFYVGKGKNGQVNYHRKEAKKLLLCESKLNKNTIKIKMIHKLWKQGLDFTEEIILGGLTEKEAFDLEIEAILVYGRIDLGTGCLTNMTSGGEGVSGPSEEARQKIRENSKGNKVWLGRNHTEETKQKIRDNQMGRIPTEETRRRMTESHLGKKQPQETIEKRRVTMIGHLTTDEAKRKIGEANRGKRRTEEERQKMRDAKIGFVPWNKGRKDVYSIEALQKMSIAKTGKPSPRKGVPHTEDTKQKISDSLLKRSKTGEFV